MGLPVVVLGAGGHAKVLINALQLCCVEILGITDPDPDLQGQNILGVPVLGTDAKLQKYSQLEVMLVNGLGSVARPDARQNLFNQFKKQGYKFTSVIHPSAVIASDVVFSEGVQIMAGVVIQPGVFVGDNVIVNTRACVDHDCYIDKHSHLAPGVTLSGDVVVGESVHVGTGSSIMQGVRLGKNCLVGAGSLVLRDVPSGAKAYGSPVKVVKE